MCLDYIDEGGKEALLLMVYREGIVTEFSFIGVSASPLSLAMKWTLWIQSQKQKEGLMAEAEVRECLRT